MIGKASNKEIDNFHKLGIDHKGIVSEDEKFSIYLRSKVFLFPSTREGFGMAVAEALYAGLSVVAWRIPVFEELYDHIRDLERLQLINRSDYQSFAREASRILYSLQTKMMAPEKKDRINNLKKWKDVSERVMKVLDGMNDQSRLI
jgi:glycosyltransferase involved in cell wall biosynthesis